MKINLQVRNVGSERGGIVGHSVEGDVEFSDAELHAFVRALTVSRLANTSRFTPREAVNQAIEIANQFVERGTDADRR